ncbi:MAG TPA: hypothetical protein VFG68_21180 [Fimbriiglobus sp.]|nr:hypothetical protein [Fimbriiglobus sp.]
MSPDFVRRTVTRRPFRPFIIHLAGGRAIPVRSPEFIQVPPEREGRLIVVENLNGSAHVIDLLLVTDLEFPNTPMV